MKTRVARAPARNPKTAAAAVDAAPQLAAVPEPADAALSGTLSRGLAILDALLRTPQRLTLAEIAGLVSLDQSTTYRILATLESEGHVIKLQNERRYLPSPKSLRPLPLAHPLEQFRRDAEPVIAELAAELRITVVLVAYVGRQRLVVDVAQSAGTLMPYYDSWLAGPLHASAPGKALLLAASPERRRELLGAEPYRDFTARSKLTAQAVEADLALAQQRGFVYQQDEYYDGITAIACNYGSWNGRPLGCIAVTGRSRDLDAQQIEAIGRRLIQAALLLRMRSSALAALDPICAV